MKRGIGILGIGMGALMLMDYIIGKVSITSGIFPHWYVVSLSIRNNIYEVLFILLILYSLIIGIWLVYKHRAKKEV